MSAGKYVHAWVAGVMSILSAGRPVQVRRLAEQVGATPVAVQRFLEEHPHALLTGEGWVDGLSLAEGVTFLHELSEIEADAGVLAADGELALWAQLASAGLPLAAGGVVRARALPELPLRLRDAVLPAGRGLIGQALVGPQGWLSGFGVGDLLAVQLIGGALEVTFARQPAGVDAANAAAVVGACAIAAAEAAARFREGEGELPAVPLPGVLAHLLATRPELFAAPLAPLRRWLRVMGLETFGGHVGLRGTAWNRGRVRDLSRDEEVDATLALAALMDGEGDGSQRDAHLLEPAQMLELMSTSPAVVGYVAGEVERRTAAEGASFAAALDGLRAAAGTPAQRAAVALWSARAAEGAGDSETAEREVHRALADWPDLVPALMDAGEYAACHGELRAAEGYLRRADRPVAEALRAPIRSLLAGVGPAAVRPGGGVAGRNQPCPCGSGRKRKLCCLASASGYPLAARAELLYALLGSFVQRAAGMERLGLLVTRSGRNKQATMLSVDALLVYEGLAERFLRVRGRWLRADERSLVEEWSRTPIVAYEVRQVRPGSGATVRTLPDGAPVFLRDRLFSTSVHRLDLFCGRLLSDGSRARVLGLPVVVDRDRRRELLELLASSPSAGKLAEFFGPQPEPYLRNSDGHDYFDAEVTLEFADPAAAWRRLAADPELVEVDEDKKLDLQVDTDGRTVSRGTVAREGRCLVLWANSRERLAELQERVRAVVLTAQEVGRRAERIGGEPPGDDRRVRTLVIDSHIMPGGPSVTEESAREEMLREHRRSWVDTPNDLGMTPREAAKAGGPARVELEALLDDMEWRNDRLAEEGRPSLMDVGWLRRELGILANT